MRNVVITLLTWSTLTLSGCGSFLATMQADPIEDHPKDRTFGQLIEDDNIETKAIVNIHAANQSFHDSNLVAVCYNGYLLLAGQVSNEALKSEATAVARKIHGVRRIYNELEIAANEAEDADLAAMAFIKRAEAIRASLHYGAEDAEAEVVTSQIAQARKAYTNAATKAQGNVSLSAKAEFGLGLCAEELAEYDGAQKIYQKIVDTPAYAATVFPTQAQTRLDNMDDNKAKFVFVDAPEPEPVLEPAPALETLESAIPNPVEVIVTPETEKAVETVVE
jgi:uncharacterized protein YceK